MTVRSRACAFAALIGGLVWCGGALGAEAPSATAQPAVPSSDPATDDGDVTTERWALHAQSTVIEQGELGFVSPYRGENSLDPSPRGREAVNATLFAGGSPWAGAQIWANPEFEQGAALSDSRGVAGYLNAEAPRGGSSAPVVRLQRLFLAQTVNLGGKLEHVDGDENVLAGYRRTDRIVLTIGKFAVGDIFGVNDIAGDSSDDFLNASILSVGSFDAAGDYSGYTYGLASEYYRGPWAWRLGVFDMTSAPDGGALDVGFGQFQIVGEVERRFIAWGRGGSFRVTAFNSRARMGDYADAVREGLLNGSAPNVDDVQSYRNRAGVSFDLQQAVTRDLGLFLRAGWADGHVQSREFADIDQSVNGGIVLQGRSWGRQDDEIGLAFAVNQISASFKSYLDHGGLGLAVGDGELPHSGSENIVECFYRWSVSDAAHVTLDYQLVDNPAYNRDRGPVSVLAIRVHASL